MTPVSFSLIKSIGYAAETNTLYVKFNNNSVYKYADVPNETYDKFLLSESPGNFFAKEIKGKYQYFKL